VHPSFKREPADLIDGNWIALKGDQLRSTNPAHPDETIWQGTPIPAHVDQAVAAAREAFHEWSRFPFDRRAAVLYRFAKIAHARANEMTALIRDEVGKPTWDATAEAALLTTKVAITLDQGDTSPIRRVSGYDIPLGDTRRGKTWFRPHGAMAVLGPFNFPAHLPNGHIIPALALGNTIVFKPSDKTPATGQLLAEFFQQALEEEHAPGGGRGVFNLVQGQAPIAAALSSHNDIDGVLFTGSWPVGRRIMQANLDRPGRILALEMGGNNPAVILEDADLKQAAIECVRSAFITAGQRCTCTRRLIIQDSIGAKLIPALCKAASSLIIGDPKDPNTFMGPVISREARDVILNEQARMHKAGGRTLVQSTALDAPGAGWYISPGIMEVDTFTRGQSDQSPSPSHPLTVSPSQPLPPGADIEVFGPFLRICTVRSLDEALSQANATDFGLAASLFTKSPAAIEAFQHACRAGCLNINTGTAGASSKLPFGGLGKSGNHRPAGSFSVDYCAYPVAGMIEQSNAATIPPGMRFEDNWLH
jgi:succinylglutamic semialdehyde dehydrogenase